MLEWKKVGAGFLVVVLALSGVGAMTFDLPSDGDAEQPTDRAVTETSAPGTTVTEAGDDSGEPAETATQAESDDGETQTREPTSTNTVASSGGGGGGGGGGSDGTSGGGDDGTDGGAGDGGDGTTDEGNQTAITVGSAELPPGERREVSLSLESAPDGMAGFRTTVTVDTDVASVDDAAIAEDFERISNVSVAEDGSGVTIEGVDADETVDSGASDRRLATITLAGVENGSTALAVTSERFDDDEGAAKTVETANGTVTVDSTSGSGE